MLNARIEFQTEELPYKVKREMPSLLEPYFKEDSEWMVFCDRLDLLLQPYEDIKASFMVVGVCFVCLCLGVIAGLICRFLIVDDEDVGLILSASIFAGMFVIFTCYFFLMQLWVVRPLDALSQDMDAYCNEIAAKWPSVEFQFQRSKKCSIYWDSDFDAWINVTDSEPADLNP